MAVASAAVDHGPAKNGAVVEKAPEVIPPSPKPAPAEASPAKTVAVKEPSLKETPVKEPPAKVASPQEPPAKAPPEKPAALNLCLQWGAIPGGEIKEKLDFLEANGFASVAFGRQRCRVR